MRLRVTVDSILGKLSLWCMQNHEKVSDLMSKPCINLHEPRALVHAPNPDPAPHQRPGGSRGVRNTF
jgi:hypothetical protein